MTIESEKRFLLLLSSFLQKNTATKKSVLDYIEEHDWIVLSEEDLKIRRTRNELIWKNDLAYTRKHLAMEGFFVATERNNWSITDNGKEYLLSLFQEVLSCNNFSKIKESAILAAKACLLTDTTIRTMNVNEFYEGSPSLRSHIIRERNRDLVEKAKRQFQENHQGKLYCEICGFDFNKVYGDFGNGFIEVHHIKPISTMREGETTKDEDLAMLCSNCHSIIHRKQPWLSMSELKAVFRKN